MVVRKKMKMIERLQKRSIEKDDRIIESTLEYNPNAKLLDLGCGDGIRTERFANYIGTGDIVGVDAKDWSVPFRLIEKNLDGGIPFGDGTFDVVISHHVIEHIKDTDLHIQEIRRVLKKGGYAVFSTPNMASGLVILELLLNKQPKWAHISDYLLPGYPKEQLETHKGYLHRRLFTMEGLVRLLEHYGFKVEHKRRHGYGPFLFGTILMGLYAANLLVKVRRL